MSSKTIKGSIAAIGSMCLVMAAMSPAQAAPEPAEVRTLPLPGTVVGDATLNRGPNGVSFTFQTTGLTKGHAYTIWVVTFTNPEECTGGCGADDLSDPDVQGSSLFGAGHFANGKQSTFSGHRSVGDPSDPAKGEVGPGLIDPLGSEIHLVLRTHGPKIQGLADDQISSFNGGCNPGEPNVGLCSNVQLAKYLP